MVSMSWLMLNTSMAWHPVRILLRGSRFRSKIVSRSAVLLLVLGITLLPAPVQAAAIPTFVQTRAKEVTSGTTNGLAFNNSNTAGNLIVVYVVWCNVGTVSLSDTRGNAYASAQAPTRWSNNQWSAQVFYAKNIAAGTNTVTATFGAAINNFGILYLHEYSGIDRVNPLDVSNSAIGTSSAMSSGAATTTNANDLIFGAGASSHTSPKVGAGLPPALLRLETEPKTER
jgi:hypothetical protein